MRRLILLTATLIGLAFIVSGCMTRTVEYQGVKYRQCQIGINQSVGRLSIQIPDGPKVEIENYSSDGAQAIGVAVEAAVKAAIKSAAPTP
jgi:hypothetical protein